MSLMCSLGVHQWKGCTCGVCAKERAHDWRSDCERCARCDTTRSHPHEWRACKCSECGKLRNEQHDWSRDCEKCGQCGQKRGAAHAWLGERCTTCGTRLDVLGLLQKMGATSDSDQCEVLGALCSEGASSMIAAIAPHLGRSHASAVRESAAKALGIIGDVRGVDPLCAALGASQDSSLPILSEVAAAIRLLADSRAVDPLLRLLASCDALSPKVGNTSRSADRDFGEMRAAMFIGLCHSEVIRAIGVFRPPGASQYLLNALPARAQFVSEAAIEAFAEGFPEVTAALESVLLDKSLIDERRIEAARALGASNDSAAVDALARVARDPSDSVRKVALIALSKMSHPSACGVAVEFQVGLPQALEPLREAFQGASGNTRSAMARALAQLGDPLGADVLAAGLSEPKERREAALHLARLGDPRCYGVLTSLLQSSDEWDRYRCAEALGRLGDARALEVLVPLLSDKEYNVRLGAAAGLAILGDLRAFDLLLHGLWCAASDSQRGTAMDALGRCNDPRAPRQLVLALRGATKETRRHIGEALALLGEKAVAALRLELEDPRPIVRQHAAEALEFLETRGATLARTGDTGGSR